MTKTNFGFSILLSIILLFPPGFLFHASGNIMEVNNSAKKIKLSGRLQECGLRSSDPEITAIEFSSSIELLSKINLKKVTIEITDQYGNIVFAKKGDLNAGQKISIRTIDWDEGEYNLAITSEDGGYISGIFEL